MDKEEMKRRLRAKAAESPKIKKALEQSEHKKVKVPVRRLEKIKDLEDIADLETAGTVKKKLKTGGTRKLNNSFWEPFMKVSMALAIVAIFGFGYYIAKESIDSEKKKYEALKSAYDILLNENVKAQEAYGAETDRLNEEIDALTEENLRIGEQLSDLESIIGGIELKEAAAEANPYDNTYVSEYYVSKKKSWNLIENVKNNNGTSDYIEINDKFYYAIYSPNRYDSKKELLSTESADVSQGQYYDFGSDCKYVTLSYSATNTYFVSTGILTGSKERPDRGNYFYVVGKNAPANVSLSYAGRCLKSGGTILVLPGTYIDNVDVQNKSANIIGVDRNLCSLISYEKDYFKPPLEISAGKVTNLTIEAINDGRHSAELSAYGIHADFDYLADKTLTIDNCVIKSDYNSSIGIGLRRGKITISNCVFDDIFFHDAADSKLGGEQNIVFKNNSFTDLLIHSQENDNAKVNMTFINNTFSSISAMNVNSSGYFEGFFKGLKGFNLTSDSTGNSMSDVNY